MEKMKVLAICTSPTKGGAIETVLAEVLKGSEYEGAETELYHIKGKDLRPCIGCKSCKRTGKGCIIKDDMQELHQKITGADAVVIGSPVYFYDVNAQCKIIIDRSYALEPINGGKVGGIVVNAGSMGCSGAINTLNMFYSVHGIANAGWLATYMGIEEKEQAKKAAFELGVKMIGMRKVLKAANSNSFDQLRCFAFGTHTK